MNLRILLLRPIIVAFLLVIIALMWILFAPEPFGGQASYVIVAGASMEPELQMGDLTIVRKLPVYQVGDIVTYQHPIAGPIIHRIIDQEGNQFVFKGDNNDWIDSYHPSEEDFIGKLWVHLPKMGTFLQKIRSPIWLTVCFVMVVIGIFRGLAGDKKKDLSRSRTKQKMARKSPVRARDGLEGILFGLAALAFASGILAIASFSHPIMVTESKELPYEFHGEFQYTAQAPAGIYDEDRIESGEPIYFQLTDQMEVSFQSDLTSELFSQVEGVVHMDAEISDPGGWKRVIELHPDQSFTGEAPLINGTINLVELRTMTDTLEERTGFDRAYYTLEIVARVISKAKYNGSEILDHFEPRLTFRMEEFQMVLIATEPNTPRLAQLEPVQIGYIQQAVQVQNTLSILGIEFPVRTGRWISGSGLGIALLGILVIAFLYVRANREGEEARIAMKYGSMMVDIPKGTFFKGHHRIEVNSIEDLGRFADRIGGVILHEKRQKAHHYYVHDGEITYHYQVPIQHDETKKVTKKSEEDLVSADEVSQEIEVENEHPPLLRRRKRSQGSKKG